MRVSAVAFVCVCMFVSVCERERKTFKEGNNNMRTSERNY